jgi:hypothetical protein
VATGNKVAQWRLAGSDITVELNNKRGVLEVGAMGDKSCEVKSSPA